MVDLRIEVYTAGTVSASGLESHMSEQVEPSANQSLTKPLLYSVQGKLVS